MVLHVCGTYRCTCTSVTAVLYLHHRYSSKPHRAMFPRFRFLLLAFYIMNILFIYALPPVFLPSTAISPHNTTIAIAVQDLHNL